MYTMVAWLCLLSFGFWQLQMWMVALFYKDGIHLQSVLKTVTQGDPEGF